MVIGLSILAALAGLAVCFPYATLRLGMALLTRSALWLRAEGGLPSGPVVLACTPLSYLGWLLLLAASRRRLRLLLLAGWARRGISGWLARRAGAILPQGEDSAGVESAIQLAGESLSRGEAVCVLLQDYRLACGADWTARRVLERLLSTTSAQPSIVPACLLQPTGSLFAMHGGRFIWKWPPRWPCEAEVTFGSALPASAPYSEVRQQVQELSARASISRKPRRLAVHRRFLRVAGRRPFATCWIDSTAPGQEMSYAKACAGAICLAHLLRGLLGREKMAGVWLPPGRGAALANIALAFLGKAAINLNYTAGMESVRSALSQCGCRHVLTARRFLDRIPFDPGSEVEVLCLEDLLPQVTTWSRVSAFLSVLLLPGWLLEWLVLSPAGHGMDDLATVIFSSGSTGDPKGIMLTHDNIAANVESITQWANLTPSDRLLGSLPFFHSFGYTVTLWGPLQLGASAVFHPDPRQAREVGDLCRDHRVTVNLSTATFVRFCLRKCGPQDFQSLRLLICGAEKLPMSLATEFEKRFGILPLEGYGCTELAPVVSTNLADQPCGHVTEVFNRPGTVGPPLPGVAGRVAHPETSEWLPRGEEGILAFLGANVMAGYLGKPGLTSTVMKDGWYLTGDMGVIGEDGTITITGRMSRFAKIGGEMVPLERIEEALHEAAGAVERLCAVTCIPDPERGERVIVLYLASALDPPARGVSWWREALATLGLPNLWIPAERDFHVIDEIPILGPGKLNLTALKERALSLARR